MACMVTARVMNLTTSTQLVQSKTSQSSIGYKSQFALVSQPEVVIIFLGLCRIAHKN